MSIPTERLREIADEIIALCPDEDGRELARRLRQVATELEPPFPQAMADLRTRAEKVYEQLDRLREEVFAYPDELPPSVMMEAVTACRQAKAIDDELAKLERPIVRTKHAVPRAVEVREFRYELRVHAAWLRAAQLPALPEIEANDE